MSLARRLVPAATVAVLAAACTKYHPQPLSPELSAAAFGHRSSRAGDPLLHTHVVVANGTQGPDGRWTALDRKSVV